MTIIGSIALAVFVVVFLVDGWTRPGYHPVRQPVSALALGHRGWIQATNFIVCGAVVTAGAIGVAHTFGSVLLGVAIGVFGVSLLVSGLFPMDAMRAYPPGTPDETPTEYSRRHTIHDQAGAVVFTSLPGAAIIAVAHRARCRMDVVFLPDRCRADRRFHRVRAGVGERFQVRRPHPAGSDRRRLGVARLAVPPCRNVTRRSMVEPSC